MGRVRIPFDLMTLARLLAQGSEFRIAKGLPADAVIEDTQVEGNVITFVVSSKDYPESKDLPEIDIQVEEYKRGSSS